jgi:methyl-accepting chemotaxis protein
MSNKKSILKEIKDLLFGEVKSFIDAKSGDLILRVEADAFAPELPLLVVTPDGAIAAKDGEYTLEDGTILEVVGGIIKEISSADEDTIAEEPIAEQEMAVDAETLTPAVDETGEIKKEEVVGTDKSIEEKMAEMEEKVEEMKSKMKEMESVVEEMKSATKEMASFSKSVSDKIETFVENTPAEMTFKSIKAELNEGKVNRSESNLDSIKNLRKK